MPLPAERRQTIDNKYHKHVGVSALSDVHSDETSSSEDPIAAINEIKRRKSLYNEEEFIPENFKILPKESTTANFDFDSEEERISIGCRLSSGLNDSID